MNYSDPPVIRLTRFLDHLIEDHGHQLFVGFGYLGLAIIFWILVRPRRQRPGQDVRIVILPLVKAPKADREPPESEEY